MKMKELTPGYYKIQKRYYQYSGRRKQNNNTIHLLRVEGYGEQIKYFIDNDLQGFNTKEVEDFEEFEMLTKLNGPPEVRNARITISFMDETGTEYGWSMVGSWTLRALFEELPWLKKPFGFIPHRSRIARK